MSATHVAMQTVFFQCASGPTADIVMVLGDSFATRCLHLAHATLHCHRDGFWFVPLDRPSSGGLDTGSFVLLVFQFLMGVLHRVNSSRHFEAVD